MNDDFWLKLLDILDVMGWRWAQRAILDDDKECWRRCRELPQLFLKIMKRITSDEAKEKASWYGESWFFHFAEKRRIPRNNKATGE